MQAGCRLLSMFALLAALMCAGCGYLDPFRQGLITTYKPELRQLAADIDRAELAKINRPGENSAGAEECEEKDTQPPNSWQPASLLPAVRIQPPVGIEGLPMMPQ
jgi:hypothetical protein